jgi:hypothetical protein
MKIGQGANHPTTGQLNGAKETVASSPASALRKNVDRTIAFADLRRYGIFSSAHSPSLSRIRFSDLYV